MKHADNVLNVKSEGEQSVRQVGRPSLIQDGKRVNVYLDQESLDIASKLGNGNVSEGIRIALQRSTK